MVVVHWHTAVWRQGSLGVGATYNGELRPEGQHGELIDEYGAYAYPLNLPDDEVRWVCHWRCWLTHPGMKGYVRPSE